MSDWPIVIVAVMAGGLLQGSTGVGFALVVSPVLAIVAPQLLPACVLILMLPLNAYVAWRERRDIDRVGASWITLGRCVGAVIGLAVLALLSGAALRVFVGIATIMTAVGSMLTGTFVLRPRVFIAAGVVTGITETSTGIGGPPLALVYQHQRGPVLRATLAVCFFVGQVISLALLALTGRLEAVQVATALWLAPALAVGALASRWLHGRIDGRPMRLAMIAFAFVSGAICLF